MKRLLPGLGMALLVILGAFHAAAETNTVPWDIKALSTAPRMFDASQYSDNDVKAVFYEGLPWQGKSTRVFAYYGIPQDDGKAKVPAMVLVHGGGGSAFIPWVRLIEDQSHRQPGSRCQQRTRSHETIAA